MTASWNFSFGLSLTTFIGTLIVVSLFTPAYRDVAAAINGPTLTAAAAMETISCPPRDVKAPEILGPYAAKCAGGSANGHAVMKPKNVSSGMAFNASRNPAPKPGA